MTSFPQLASRAVLAVMAITCMLSPVEQSARAQSPLAPATLSTVTVGPGGSLTFVPATQAIPVGETIHWVWASAAIPHSTTSGSCAGAMCTPDGQWDSGVHLAPFSFDVTFTTAGAFPYFCTVHGASMQGTILVSAGDTPITGLSASNSSPTRLGSTTAFTAMITGGSNVTYQWNFGDGATDSGVTTTHTYGARGDYTAQVTATNSLSLAVATTRVTITVPLFLPVVIK